MKSKIVLMFAVAGLSIASAKSYNVTFPDSVVVNGTALAAGEYAMTVDGTAVTLRERGTHNVTQANATLETAERKFDSTSIISSTVDGKDRVNEIDLGGTKTKVEFGR